MYIVKKLSNKVGLRLEVGELTSEMEDLKSEVGERRSREIHPNLTLVDYIVQPSSACKNKHK